MATPLPKIDESHLKSALTAAKQKRLEGILRREDAALLTQQVNHRKSVAQVLRPFFTKAGLDIEKLDKMSAQNQSELRRIFQSHKAEIAQRASLEMAAIREGFQQQARALRNLAGLPVVPFTAITLQPIFIWQTHVDSFKGSHIEPGNNWVKFLIEAMSGAQVTEFSFVFLWQNQRNDLAVVNVASSLVLNGACEVVAATGVISGDTSDLLLNASLTLLGLWQPDPQNPELPPPNPPWEQSQFQNVLSLEAHGGAFWDSPDYHTKNFSASSFDLRYNFFLIPPQSSAAFEVNLVVEYNFPGGGGNISDYVVADFAADNLGYELMCPGLQLDLLTVAQAVA
jgi:hypothetical protein